MRYQNALFIAGLLPVVAMYVRMEEVKNLVVTDAGRH